MPPLGDPPQKNCFRVNVLAFCSYLLQIPISHSNMPSQLSDCTRCNLRAPKIQNFLGGRPPRPPQKPVFEVHRILHTKFTLSPLKTKNFHFAPLGEFSKKNTDIHSYVRTYQYCVQVYTYIATYVHTSTVFRYIRT